MFCVICFRDEDPLVFAIRQGDLKAFNDVATSAAHCLLREDQDGWMPLHDAAFCGQTECAKTILKGTALRLNRLSTRILHIKGGPVHLMYVVFPGTAHPSLVDKRTLQEQTALLLAVSGQHLSCARCLLEGGADPDISSKNKETPLYKGQWWSLQRNHRNKSKRTSLRL